MDSLTCLQLIVTAVDVGREQQGEQQVLRDALAAAKARIEELEREVQILGEGKPKPRARKS